MLLNIINNIEVAYRQNNTPTLVARMGVWDFIWVLLIFAPGGDVDVVNWFVDKRADICSGEACVSQQWNVVVDCRAANAITICQLALAVVLWYIDYQVDAVVSDEVEDIFTIFIGPTNSDSFHAV